jgi:APA family basic amino acid/polyamine antiporter
LADFRLVLTGEELGDRPGQHPDEADPQKLLPKAIIIGIIAVLVIYTLITFRVFRFLPAEKIHQLGEGATGYLATAAFGKVGGRLLSIGIIISMMGTINGKIMTFPRIVYAMAKRRDLPFSRYLAYITPKAKEPVVANRFYYCPGDGHDVLL